MITLPTLRASPQAWALAALIDAARLVPSMDSAGVTIDVADRSLFNPGDLPTLRAHEWGITVGDGTVVIDPALFGLLVSVVGAGTEQRSSEQDRHGRVPSSAHPLVRWGAERDPLLNDAATVFRTAVERAAGRKLVVLAAPWPEGHRWAAALTHDLDVVDWWPAFTALRLRELFQRGELGLAARVLAAAAGAVGKDPVSRAVEALLTVEAAHNIRSTWFILSGTPTLATMRVGDLTYKPEGSRARGLLAAVGAGGHELELHGSFSTWLDVDRFRAERGRLAGLVGAPPRGVRQHYLRMRPGRTQRLMCQAGFEWDASYGFADRNGFRLGAADVVAGWDAAASGPSGLDEVPFMWMDRALSKYRKEERPAVWTEDALELAGRCRKVEGLWVGVWHPNLSPALGFPGAPEAFQDLVSGLCQTRPWLARLDEVVMWRRRRRELRVERILPDGRPVLSVPTIPIEAVDGRPLRSATPDAD
ncbi:MAG TPA: hypothetical protein VGA22_01420 [Gemmatimonadales bacterium]